MHCFYTVRKFDKTAQSECNYLTLTSHSHCFIFYNPMRGLPLRKRRGRKRKRRKSDDTQLSAINVFWGPVHLG